MTALPSPSHAASAVRYLRRSDAAEYVRHRFGFPCSKQWLAKLAVVGGGPVFRKAGRTPLYLPTDLDAWANARIGAPRRSTADVARAPDRAS